MPHTRVLFCCALCSLPVMHCALQVHASVNAPTQPVEYWASILVALIGAYWYASLMASVSASKLEKERDKHEYRSRIGETYVSVTSLSPLASRSSACDLPMISRPGRFHRLPSRRAGRVLAYARMHRLPSTMRSKLLFYYEVSPPPPPPSL